MSPIIEALKELASATAGAFTQTLVPVDTLEANTTAEGIQLISKAMRGELSAGELPELAVTSTAGSATGKTKITITDEDYNSETDRYYYSSRETNELPGYLTLINFNVWTHLADGNDTPLEVEITAEDSTNRGIVKTRTGIEGISGEMVVAGSIVFINSNLG